MTAVSDRGAPLGRLQKRLCVTEPGIVIFNQAAFFPPLAQNNRAE